MTKLPRLSSKIMTNDADEFLFVAKYEESFEDNELNWELCCPYPMAPKR